MDPSSGSNDIPKNTKMELPCWLAQALVSQQRSAIRVDLPQLFAENYRQVLTADAEVVDLHKLSPMFYGFGFNLLKFASNEMYTISDFVTKTFVSRISWLFDRAQHSTEEERPSQMGKLEGDLYDMGKWSQESFATWTRRFGQQVLPVEQNGGRKRKRSTA